MKYFFLALLPFFAITSNAQLIQHEPLAKEIKVSEVWVMRTFLYSLSYTVQGKDTTYTIIYRNARYKELTDIKSLEFDGADGTLDQFYNLLLSFFTDPNKSKKDYKESITLGKTLILISYQKSMGFSYIDLFMDDGFFSLNQKQLNKLFGR